MTLELMEKQANRLIKQGETDPAVRQIYEIIIAWAKKKDFSKAESWREKMIELNPMALSEIIGSGEVLESEKASAIDYDHKTIWRKLYTSLTVAEGNAFYMALHVREFPPGKVLIQQGKLNSTIFFVESGQIKTIYRQGNKESFINFLNTGDIAGQDTFFNVTNCTSSVVTVNSAKVRFLNKSVFEEFAQEFPELEGKIEDFCSLADAKNPKNVLKTKSLERRQLRRHKVMAITSVQTLNKTGEPDGPAFYGQLEDISSGGASFNIISSNKDVGRTLLGRSANLVLDFQNGPQLKIKGVILGARFDGFNAHIIHFKFSKPFDTLKLKQIIKLSSPPLSSSKGMR